MTPKKMFYTMLVCMFLIIGGCAYLFVVTRDELRNDIVEITDKKLEVELADGEVRQLLETQEKYAEYAYLRDELGGILPQDKEQSEAVQRLIGLFSEAQVPIGGISFLGTDGLPSTNSQTQETNIKGVSSLPIDVTVPEPIPYEKAIRLLKILENSERHLNVENFGLTSTSGEEVPDGYVNVSVSVDLQLKEASGISEANTSE